MKIDITNVHGILSRKIAHCLPLVFFFFLLGVSPLGALPETGNSSVSITVDQLRSLPPKATVIIDTRSSWKYIFGHIPGAINLSDWRTFTRKVNRVPGMLIEDSAWVARKLRPLGIDTHKTLVLYGNPQDPWRTDGRFFWMFERYGFPRVTLLSGGLDSWIDSGGSIERGRGDPPPPSTITPEDIRLNPGVLADKNWILKRLQSGGVAIIDNRTQKEFEGATPYGSPRGGHIPNAIHLPWEQLFTDEGKLKPRKVLTRLLEGKGIRPDQEIVVYCTGGVRSGMAYFAFRSLGYAVRNYDGSWWDWSQNPGLPVEL